MIPLERVRAAAARAAPHLRRTPVLELDGGRRLKLELLQPTGSFKVRGYFAAALQLSPEERRAGLLTVSAGNAAAGCAYVAAALGVPCRVVMVDTVPAPKLAAVQRWGARVTLLPREQLFAWMGERAWEGEPEAFIHPHTDEELAAGHGGLALELLEQVPAVSRVLVPVGGGGLVTGVAAGLRAAGRRVEVVGVMSDGYPLWPEAIAAGGDPRLVPATIADGTAAPFNAVMFDRLRECVDRWLVVPEPRLRAAVRELAVEARVVAEGAGALAYAALEQVGAEGVTVALVTGGNIGAERLGEILGG